MKDCRGTNCHGLSNSKILDCQKAAILATRGEAFGLLEPRMTLEPSWYPIVRLSAICSVLAAYPH